MHTDRWYKPLMSTENDLEPTELLSDASKNLHRAIVSLKEELDAIDWYQRRAEACSDAELRAVLIHNKNEEIEHAMMILEWLRRHDPEFAAKIGTFLNSSGSIIDVEHKQTGDALEQSERSVAASLGIAGLKEVT